VKRKFALIIFFAFLTIISCQKFDDILNFHGSSPKTFIIGNDQTIYFHFDNKGIDNVIKMNVLSVDNHLCPTSKHIFCDRSGYIILKLRVSKRMESDTITLNKGDGPLKYMPRDSATITFDLDTYKIYLLNAKYYPRFIPQVEVTVQIFEI
jgi:hypothetical protein